MHLSFKSVEEQWSEIISNMLKQSQSSEAARFAVSGIVTNKTSMHALTLRSLKHCDCFRHSVIGLRQFFDVLTPDRYIPAPEELSRHCNPRRSQCIASSKWVNATIIRIQTKSNSIYRVSAFSTTCDIKEDEYNDYLPATRNRMKSSHSVSNNHISGRQKYVLELIKMNYYT